VQSRLLTLGYDLGPTGVDGVFWGATLLALTRFQQAHGLTADGVVGPETWSALVDATFRLGDRLLYLRLPYLHGADVRTLQGALNVLGFACGEPDGIFGPYTERAVGEFQSNVGLPSDGIAGTDTVRALSRLQHVWKDKDPSAPAALGAAPARASEVLKRLPVVLAYADPCAREVCGRVVNLALAAEPEARVGLTESPVSGADALILHVMCEGQGVPTADMPVITIVGSRKPEGRFIAAFEGAPGCREARVVVPAASADSEHDAQTSAVRILDGVCAVLSRLARPVLP
jgi:peptidoglycan hydrolase-like protein with peptidoglycan-binding domain